MSAVCCTRCGLCVASAGGAQVVPLLRQGIKYALFERYGSQQRLLLCTYVNILLFSHFCQLRLTRYILYLILGKRYKVPSGITIFSRLTAQKHQKDTPNTHTNLQQRLNRILQRMSTSPYPNPSKPHMKQHLDSVTRSCLVWSTDN